MRQYCDLPDEDAWEEETSCASMGLWGHLDVTYEGRSWLIASGLG